MAKAYENYQPPYDDINEPNVKNTLERDIAYTKDEIVEIDERILRLEVRRREAVANGDPRAGDIGRTIQSQEEYKIRRQNVQECCISEGWGTNNIKIAQKLEYIKGLITEIKSEG